MSDKAPEVLYKPDQRAVVKPSRVPTREEVLAIARPERVPTAPPKPMVTQPSIPRMSAGLDKPPPNFPLPVTRVGHADVGALSLMAEGAFGDWPNATPAMLAHYLYQAVDSNVLGAYRTLNAFAVVELVRHPFEARNIARVLFAFAKAGTKQEELDALMLKCLGWSRAVGAAKFELTEYVNFDLEPVVKRLELGECYRTWWVRLDG